MNLEQEERRLLAQQRRGYRRLCFVPELEQGFVGHRVQRIHRRLLLIVSTAIVFQLIYTVLDLLLMPLAVSLSVVPLRVLGILAVLAGFVYFRRPQSPPRRALFAYTAAYALNGACVAVIIHLCWTQGEACPTTACF